MNLEQLKAEIALLSAPEQKHLAGYLMYLRRKDDPAWQQEIAARIDDKNSESWLTLEQLREK